MVVVAPFIFVISLAAVISNIIIRMLIAIGSHVCVVLIGHGVLYVLVLYLC